MNHSRSVARLVATNLSRLPTLANSSSHARQFFYRNSKNLPDVFFGSARNMFRDFEREFERMQHQFDNYFRGITDNTNRALINYPNFATKENGMIVVESDGSRKLQLVFDMHGFEPEEVKLKTQNGALTVSAKKEKKAGNSYSLHEFSQTYTLPEDLKIDDLKSSFTENGVLTIEAPLPKIEPKTREIKIEHSK